MVDESEEGADVCGISYEKQMCCVCVGGRACVCRVSGRVRVGKRPKIL